MLRKFVSELGDVQFCLRAECWSRQEMCESGWAMLGGGRRPRLKRYLLQKAPGSYHASRIRERVRRVEMRSMKRW